MTTDLLLASRTATAPRVAVLGAGLTGLTVAWHLHRAGLAPLVIERSGRVGGAIGAWREGEWLHELGPNSMLEGSAGLRAFVDELGLGSRRLYAAPAARNRYVVRGGRLVAMPSSPGRFATTGLFSLQAKLGLMAEVFRPRAPAEADESVAHFVRRRLGSEFLDYAVEPFVAGVYAGDAERLSVRHGFPKLHALEQEHGSLLRGAFRRRNPSGGPAGRIFSFPTGLQELPHALAKELGLSVRLRTTIHAIRPAAGGWQIVSETGDLIRTEFFSAVVSALPADALAALPLQGGPELPRLDAFAGIEHPPVASVFTGYRREDVAHPLDGFGLLMPRVEHGNILGTLFSSTLFPSRAPAGHVALTTFVGGSRQPELTLLEEERLLGVVARELAGLLGVRAAPVFAHVQRWPRAIPQYTVGYGGYLQAMAGVEAAAPGFFVGGNARQGVSLANCVESGRRLAEAVAKRLGR